MRRVYDMRDDLVSNGPQPGWHVLNRSEASPPPASRSRTPSARAPHTHLSPLWRDAWLDTEGCGASDAVPDGLSELEGDELDPPVHPALDPALSGIEEGASPEHPGEGPGREQRGGRKNHYREPRDYVELMKSVGVRVDPQTLVMSYYGERAPPHLVPFPEKLRRQAADSLPEGLEIWDVGSPIAAIDWTGTLVKSPIVVPGLATKTGLQIAQEEAARAKGGATAVLRLRVQSRQADVDRLKSLGWKVHPVVGLPELEDFARAFARARFGAAGEWEAAA
jgi:hypothetical protein